MNLDKHILNLIKDNPSYYARDPFHTLNLIQGISSDEDKILELLESITDPEVKDFILSDIISLREQISTLSTQRKPESPEQ